MKNQLENSDAVMIEQLVIDFLTQFNLVFEEDWSYTHQYISEELNTERTLLSDLRNNNCNNIDNLRSKYDLLINHLAKSGAVQKYFDPENIKDDYSKFLFFNRYLNTDNKI